MLNSAQLVGLSHSHVAAVAGEAEHIRLQTEVAAAYQQMREAARVAGVTLAIASGFRDFARQMAIWNRKFNHQAPLYDDTGRLLDPEQLSIGEKLDAILMWSALPGASRHHWGTDFDIYDPEPFQHDPDLKLELIASEYDEGGPCHSAFVWLRQHAHDFGFFFPYARYRGGVAAEPWHLSYRAAAEPLLQQLSDELLAETLRNHPIAGGDYVLERLADIKARYIDNICTDQPAGTSIWFG